METLAGIPASKGVYKGVIRIVNNDSEMRKFKKGEVLVSRSTNPLMAPIMVKAGAIITVEGGKLCHTAIISREFGIPCVVGVKNLFETLKNGDTVIVDGGKGIITILK